jgi:hypothetical protein
MPDGRSARLIKDYKVRMADNRIITVPSGFETDFASVPAMDRSARYLNRR